MNNNICILILYFIIIFTLILFYLKKKKKDDSKYSQLQEKTIEELRLFCFKLFDNLIPNTTLCDMKVNILL